MFCFFFSSRRRHTRCALVTGVQTCALPIWRVTGSPGSSRIKAKATRVMPKKVGMSWASRVTTKRNMEQVPGPDHGRKELAPLPPVTRSRPSGLLLDVHAVEDVTAEGIDLEVLHFLAHRLEHHRMCDGGPGRLLLEDDLSLLVELRPDRKSTRLNSSH